MKSIVMKSAVGVFFAVLLSLRFVGAVELGNDLLKVVFDERAGTFDIIDVASGEKVLVKAGVGATSQARGANFSYTKERVTDELGEGERVVVSVRDDSIGARWSFYDAGYQHASGMNGPSPVYTYTIYKNRPCLVMGFGIKTPVWYRMRLRDAMVMRGGSLWDGAAITSARTINSAAGAEPAHLLDGMTRRSSNGLLVTALVNGRRRALVAGGLRYDAFGAYAEMIDGAVTLYSNDPVGVLIDPGTNFMAIDSFYLDCISTDIFAAAEEYGRAMRRVNCAAPNVYDFPLLCGWAVGALSHLGNINNSAKLVEEMDIAVEKGYTRYGKVGVRLEPDFYCYSDRGNSEQGWYDDEHWAKYGHLVKPYDTFAKWCKAISDRNGVPYTYFQCNMPSHDFERKYPERMLFNTCAGTEKGHMHHQPYCVCDYTDNDMVSHMRQMWQRLRLDGMQGIKFDYPETAYRVEGGFDDYRKSSVQVYRDYFKLAREGLGPAAFLDERNLGESGRPCLDCTAGIVDTQRVWSDSNQFDPRMITTAGLRWWKSRTVFDYYPDSKAIHDMPAGLRHSLISSVYLTSGRLELATSFRLFTPEMVHDVSRLYPEFREPFAPRPIDAFKPGVINPSVYDLELTDDRHAVMLFNPQRRRATISTALCGDRVSEGALGLSPKSRYHAYRFWNDEYLGLLGEGDSIKADLLGRYADVVNVVRDLGHPQVVSTTRHVLQGHMEISNEIWRDNSLSGVIDYITAGDTEIITIAAGCPVKSASSEYSVTNGLVRLAVKGTGKPIAWSVTFEGERQPSSLKPTRFGVDETEQRIASVKCPPLPPAPQVRIETLTPTQAKAGWGEVLLGKGYDGKITIGGHSYEGGMAIHANGSATFARKPEWKRVVAIVGIDEAMRSDGRSSVSFKIVAEHPGGESDLASSPEIRFGEIEEWFFNCEIPDGVTAIRFETSDAGDGNGCDHADWAECGFLTAP